MEIIPFFQFSLHQNKKPSAKSRKARSSYLVNVLFVYFRIRLKGDQASGCIEQHLGSHIHIVVLNQSFQSSPFQY